MRTVVAPRMHPKIICLPESRMREMVPMKTDFFFTTVQDPSWAMNGDPWSSWRDVFDSNLTERIRKAPIEEAGDLDVAQGLIRLVHAELELFGTSQTQLLSDEEIAEALRALLAVLRRLGVAFNLPFRDFRGFHGYWSAQEMGGVGGWAARRGYLTELFKPVWARLDELEQTSQAHTGIRGVDGTLKNIIFASTGPKPEVVLSDSLDNVIETVENGDHCLVYDRPLGSSGLSWSDLVTWWSEQPSANHGPTDQRTAHGLYKRLWASLQGNHVEEAVFNTYCERYRGENGFSQPALLPQVYLHFDPLTLRQRRKLGKPTRLKRERMDFLLLLPNNVRIVIEVDGHQHYAEGAEASPRLYGEMVCQDRRLRLRGYEVYRFGGYELMQKDAPTLLRTFFTELHARYSPSPPG